MQGFTLQTSQQPGQISRGSLQILTAAGAGSVLVQKTLFCTDLARTEAVLVNALPAESTECPGHHCALFLARTLNSPWGEAVAPQVHLRGAPAVQDTTAALVTDRSEGQVRSGTILQT